MTEPPLSLVDWHDAHADHGWVDRGDIDTEPRLVRSVGWVLENVKRGHLTLAQSWDPDTDSWDALLHIPICMVQTVASLRQTPLLPVGPQV